LLEADEEEEDDGGSGRRSSRGKKPKRKKKGVAAAAAAAEGKGGKNGLLNKFGFQPDADAAQANVDWEYEGPGGRASSEKGTKGKGTKKQNAGSKKRSKPEGGTSTGTPLKDRKSERRS
ncbi:unnamed protein product, partial [Ectocarpus sp. 6 AP-2014]